MQIKNQMATNLSHLYKTSPKGLFDAVTTIKEAVILPLLSPASPQKPVEVIEGGKLITEDDITNVLIACLQENIHVDEENFMKEFFKETMIYFNQSTILPIKDLFAIQSVQKVGLPEPDAHVVYSPATDIIPVSKKFIGGASSYDELFASFAFFTRADALGVYFSDETMFDQFKNYVKTTVLLLSGTLDPDVVQMFSEFDNITLDKLTDSLILRNDYSDNNEENSFARVLLHLVMEYAKQTSDAEYGIMPFSLTELFCPKNLVFINIRKHASASVKKIAKEWEIINRSIAMKLKIVNTKHLSKLTSVVRTAKKIKQRGDLNRTLNGTGIVLKAKTFKFRPSPVAPIDMMKLVGKIMDKMGNVAKSNNSVKMTKMTFAKPSRRNPDDFNRPGKMISTKYKPDIHVYLDTSGSVSEENYRDAMKGLIKMAKKMNVNLYFNSFSHILSDATLLRTKDRSVKQIYKEFQRIHKVAGGTNYAQIWQYIDASKKRKKEISLIITDFEYTAPSKFMRHCKNIYYVPLSNMNWDSMVYWAGQFCKSMKHIDPNIRAKILM